MTLCIVLGRRDSQQIWTIHNRVRETFVYVNRGVLAAQGRGSVA